MKIGYARVSTSEQNLDMQIDALQRAGCERVFDDQGVSGARKDRPGLTAAMDALTEGDVLVVWKLDRLGRSLAHLVSLVAELNARKCEFQSLTEAIDTTSAGGKLIFHIMASLAEFERSLIVERTKAGMNAVRARGKHVGRPVKLKSYQIDHARRQIELGMESVSSMALLYGVDRTTMWRGLRSLESA